MNDWTHAICASCWSTRRPDRPPVDAALGGADAETCCYCGASTQHGIYVRDNPANTKHCRHEENR